MPLVTQTDVRLTPASSSLDDQRLVEHAARVIGVPRQQITDGRFSFVLHAPLELLARAALLPLVAPRHREVARQRIVALTQGYEAAGPPLGRDHRATFVSCIDDPVRGGGRGRPGRG